MKALHMSLKFFAGGLLFLVLFYSCSKESSVQSDIPVGSQKVSIFLTDDPALFDQVNIDIQSVKVMVDTCDRNDSAEDDHHDGDHHDGGDDDHDSTESRCVYWADLDIRPGVYDLLQLRNGLDTLLASGTVPDGKIIKIRIDLGPNNSLVKDSVMYPLNLPPGMHPYVIISMRGNEWEEYGNRSRRLWLDFDVARSIITINGQFYLRPVIHFFVVRNTGSIEGKVEPREALPVISAYNSTDTAYAIPNHDGEFKIRGLAAGTYKVFINASNGYVDTTISNIIVQRGQETELNRVTLHR